MNLNEAKQVLKENGLFCERTEEIDYKELENQVLRRTEEISKNCDFPIVDAYDMNTDRFVCKCMLVKKIDVISNDEKTYYAAVRMKEQGKENTITGLGGSVCYRYNDSKRVYEDATGWGFINAEDIKKEKVIALANEIISSMKKRYSESVEVDNAIKLLKENNYIVEGHWYDSTTGFRRYREDPDEREARYYNTLVEKFKELKEADEAQDKDRIRQNLETIEIFVRRIGNAISSSDKKGEAKDGLAKMKKYFQDKGQDDLAALVDKYADEVLRLVW
jgi:hypothetical protein